MKRICMTVLALIFLLTLLTGCATGEQGNTTEASTAVQTEQPTQPGLYLPESDVEVFTGGAVRKYALDSREYSWIGAMGTDLLLATQGADGVMTVLAGDKCEIKAQETVADLGLGTELASYQAFTGNFTYYSQSTKEIVILDRQLSEKSRCPLPEDSFGRPVIAERTGKVYYCRGKELYELDPSNGITRLVRSFSGLSFSLVDDHCNGEFLRCRTVDANGMPGEQYISATTGATVYSGKLVTSLDTYGENYFAVLQDGTVQLQLFGDLLSVSQLNVSKGEGMFVEALSLGGAVHCSVNEEGALAFSFYDLSSGMRTAATAVPNIGMPTAFYADTRSDCLWFLAPDTSTGEQNLYRWTIQNSLVSDETVYTGTYYTADAPDTEGLALCQQRVDALNKTYWLDIRIWENALDGSPDYALAEEHQVSVINEMLDSLEQIFSRFSEDFLEDTADSTKNGKLKIRLVRSIDADRESYHYWHNGNLYIVICSGADAGQAFLRHISEAVITHVLGNAEELDYWEGLNPADFVYGTPLQQYLEGETRAFTDEAAMTSVTKDRAQTFLYAMTEGNESVFASQTMQAKLKLLCEGIRDAYRLMRYQEVLPWEQYLQESLAYQPAQ